MKKIFSYHIVMNYSELFDLGRNLYANFAFNNKTGDIKMPMRYILELTYRCNLNCNFCYIKNERNIEELTTKEWFDIIEQIPPFTLISFVAGEVLLRSDFLEIYKKASEKFRKVSVITNGLALNEEIIDNFIKYKLFLLSVSIDACGEKHDIIRNHSGLFNKLLSNINLFNEKKGKKSAPMLDIKTCILENNLDELPKLYKLSMDLNAKFFSLTFLRKQPLRQNSMLLEDFSPVFNETAYPAECYFDMAHFIEIYKELESLSKKSKTILRYAPRFNEKGDIEKIKALFNSGNTPITDLYKPCKIPMTSLYITPQGNVYPCLSYKIGNLKEIPLKQLINIPKYKCFRKNLHCAKIFNACQMCCDAIPKNL